MTEKLKQIGRAFIIGSGSALDLTGNVAKKINSRIYLPDRAKSAQEGLHQDWQNVGKDIRNAISGYRKSNSV